MVGGDDAVGRDAQQPFSDGARPKIARVVAAKRTGDDLVPLGISLDFAVYDVFQTQIRSDQPQGAVGRFRDRRNTA